MTGALHRSRARLLAAGALAAPFLIVQSGRLVGSFGVGPSGAGIVSAPAPDAPTPPPRQPPPTGRQREALAWSVAHPGPSTARSPLCLPPAPPPPVVAPDLPSIEPPDAAPAPPVASMRVNTIMGNNENGLAVVDGKVHRLGDELAPGWKLTTINARDRFIEITGPDSQTVRLELGT